VYLAIADLIDGSIGDSSHCERPSRAESLAGGLVQRPMLNAEVACGFDTTALALWQAQVW
jgi:hypothetical protein